MKPRVSLVKSTMTRATETGDIVHANFPDTVIKPCDMLREGGPCQPEPPVGNNDENLGGVALIWS